MKTRSIVLLVVLLCGILGLLVVGTVGGVLYYAYRNADTLVSPRIDAIVAAADEGTFDKTYTTDMCPEFRQVVTPEQYAKIGEGLRRLGKLKSKSLVSFNTRMVGGTTSTDAVYKAEFSKGPAEIRAQLVKQSDGWLFSGLYINSPLLLDLVATAKCPKCGAAHAADARFCPACGVPLTMTPTDAAKPPEQPEPEPSGKTEPEASEKPEP